MEPLSRLNPDWRWDFTTTCVIFFEPSKRYSRDGYKRVKIKIERGRDVELVRAVREAFGGIPLFVDANGAYDLSDVDVFKKLDEFDLMMFEQPFPAGMLRELAELQSPRPAGS